MRDTIKTYEYFKEYLVLNEKRLVRFQNQLKALSAENITGRQGCTAFIASLYRSRICALYSSEADINTIRKLCPQYIKYLVQAVEPQEGYFDIIDALSLCVLFGIEECLPDLKTVLRQTDVRDKLTDSLLHNLDYTWNVSDVDQRCVWFSEFLKCSPSEREIFLKSYITKNGIKPAKKPPGTIATNLPQTSMPATGALRLPLLRKYMVYLTVTSGRTIRMTWFILFDIRGSIPKGKKSMYDTAMAIWF